MTAAVRAQIKVTSGAEKLAREQQLVDMEHPDAERRMSFDESMKLIRDRYSSAIDLLGRI